VAKSSPKQPGVRVVDYAIIDEDGRRWDFDFDIGWRSDVATLVGEVRPVRTFAGHYADTPEITGEVLDKLGKEAQGGAYRPGAQSIVYVSE
jgi:hypothetical protein